jgi:outer membrane lipoprotein-sorting protein
MRTSAPVVCGAAALSLLMFRQGAHGAPSEDSAARQLIEAVLQASRTSGLRVRSKLIVTTPDHREVKQLLIKSRSDGKNTDTLYQVLWPAEFRGQALLVKKKNGGSVSGFLFEPPNTVKKLSSSLLAQPFFGSDLLIEDLAEDFLEWSSQKVVGEEPLKDKMCQIVESRPAAGASTSYALVKTWISPQLALPLRVEKYGKGGRLIRRINAEGLMKIADHWTASTIIVESDRVGSQTRLEGSKSDHDLSLPAADFTIEGIKRGLEGASLSPSPH